MPNGTRVASFPVILSTANAPLLPTKTNLKVCETRIRIDMDQELEKLERQLQMQAAEYAEHHWVDILCVRPL